MNHKLGDQIHIQSKLVRKTKQEINKPNQYPYAYTYKYWEEIPFERDGIVVGERTLQNGKRQFDSCEGWYFSADEYIKAILVAYSIREKPVYVLIKEDSDDPKNDVS